MVRISADNHAHAFRHEFEKLCNISISESDTAVTGRCSDEVLAIRPVEINVTIPRIRIFRIQT